MYRTLIRHITLMLAMFSTIIPSYSHAETLNIRCLSDLALMMGVKTLSGRTMTFIIDTDKKAIKQITDFDNGPEEEGNFKDISISDEIIRFHHDDWLGMENYFYYLNRGTGELNINGNSTKSDGSKQNVSMHFVCHRQQNRF